MPPRPSMPSIPDIVAAMLWPAGRCNRKGLLLCALVLLALQVLAALAVYALELPHMSAPVLSVDALLLWMGTCAIAKRLHDLGRSAWAILWASLGVIAWSTVVAMAVIMTMGEQALAPDGVGLAIAAAGSSLPVLALTLWAHFARGEPGPNAYGPETDDTGFSPPRPGLRPADAIG